MCYYRRLHFVSCGHQYWTPNSAIRYCPSAVPFPPIQSYPATRTIPSISACRRKGGGICFLAQSGPGVLGLPEYNETQKPIEDPDRQQSTPGVGKRQEDVGKAETSSEEGRIGLSAATEGIPLQQDPATIRDNGCPPNTPSASTSSISESDSSASSFYSTPPMQCNGGSPVLTPGTPASSSPQARAWYSATSTLPQGARRTGMMPCNLLLSHPLATYRLREICPNCRNARLRQHGRLGLLKEGLKQLRISVERMVAVEGMQEKNRQPPLKEEEADAIAAEELKESYLNDIADQGDASDEEGNGSARSRSGMLKGG